MPFNHQIGKSVQLISQVTIFGTQLLKFGQMQFLMRFMAALYVIQNLRQKMFRQCE